MVVLDQGNGNVVAKHQGNGNHPNPQRQHDRATRTLITAKSSSRLRACPSGCRRDKRHSSNSSNCRTSKRRSSWIGS